MEENWIKWEGGTCPVDQEAIVSVKFKDGDIANEVRASFWTWEHLDSDGDIVAFHFVDDADDNWIDVAAFKSCPVDPDALLEFKNVVSNSSFNMRADDYRSWGCFDEGEIFFRIIKEEKNSDGWIEWYGDKECPVEPHTKVKVKFRGTDVSGSTAESESLCDPENYWWGHDEMPSDIVAYKIVKEQKEPEKPTKTLKILTKEGLEFQEEFESLYGKTGNCSCHTGNPPCSSCTHPGHPIALEESDHLWRTAEVNEEEIIPKTSKPVDLIWGSW